MIQIVPESFQAHFIEDLSNEDYHGDKSAISSTTLRKILKSPASLYSHLTSPAQIETDAMRLGSIVHLALLEPAKFQSQYVLMPDLGDMRSPLNRKKRDEWKELQAPGAVILTEDDYARIQGMIESVLRHPEACALLKNGKAEMSGFYRDPLTGIKCRVRPDLFDADSGVLIDLKTTKDCSYDEFSKSIWSFRYDFQMAMYCEAIKLITGSPVNVPIFLAVEKEKPYEMAVYPVDFNSKLMRLGTQDYQKALVTLEHCIHTNQWRPYQTEMQVIDLPAWVNEDDILIT
jgi:hypothetical protein